MSAPTFAETRDQIALRLYAAYLDIAGQHLPEFYRNRFPERTLQEWRRVADEAMGLRKPRVAEEKPPPPRRRMPVRPSSRTGGSGDHKFWCEQCDRQVTAGFAEACQSPFCRAKAGDPT